MDQPNTNEPAEPHASGWKSGSAPRLLVPAQSITSIEHPCVIKNLDKGIKSLGGEHMLDQSLSTRKNVTATLRPDDPFAKKLIANPVKTGNVLLKITVPKRTGRRRKRGTDGPFLTESEIAEQYGPSTSDPAKEPKGPFVPPEVVFRSLQDNADNYTVTAVGEVDETHRFRVLPDLQYSSVGNPLMKEIKDHLIPLTFKDLKEYKLNTAPNIDTKSDIGPPVQFLQYLTPLPYMYQQNPGVKFSLDEEGEEIMTTNANKKIFSGALKVIDPNVAEIPMAPSSRLPPEEALTEYQREVLRDVRAQLATFRKVITRHVLYNRLGWKRREKIREILPYCGYFFNGGPFREALIAYGVDPRLDPEYRHYQTTSYLTYYRDRAGVSIPKAPSGLYATIRDLCKVPPGKLEDQYKFDGHSVSRTGNIFQFCDIMDPMLRKLLDTTDFRDTCAPTTQGWYHSGTWAKLVVILRDKVLQMLENKIPNDADYEGLLSWPDKFDPNEMLEKYKALLLSRGKEKDAARRDVTLMQQARSIVRNPRYAIERFEKGVEGPEGSDEEAEFGEPYEQEVEGPEMSPDDAERDADGDMGEDVDGGFGEANEEEIYDEEEEEDDDDDDDDDDIGQEDSADDDEDEDEEDDEDEDELAMTGNEEDYPEYDEDHDMEGFDASESEMDTEEEHRIGYKQHYTDEDDEMLDGDEDEEADDEPNDPGENRSVSVPRVQFERPGEGQHSGEAQHSGEGQQ